ncbi:hypothetical protein Nepgr_026922 [Nepenthes gracilis]|uniref:Uncharacterized protein n=1 Tax=Nepenthes gracilis TaxID=150966 RepID=A0AAD3Y2K5_NEPGR|nr:hypothetical protein Nepgr_026922 [Nepenthes gracilis]
MATSGLPYPQRYGWFPVSKVGGATPTHLITTPVSLRLGHFLRRRFIDHKLRRLLRYSLKDAWNKRGC